jgi:L-ascorbate metabolism protein UlaG (beta-lactamase superfamily)
VSSPASRNGRLEGSPPRAAHNQHTAVTFVGHATTHIAMDGITLVTDPLLRDRLWHLRRDVPCDTPDCLPVNQLAAVLISHLHLDHADVASLRRIPTDVPLIAPRGTGAYLRTRLDHTVHTLDMGESMTLGGVEVTAVPAAHDGPGSSLSPLSASAGFMIRGSYTIYFAGDTALFQEMRDLGKRYDIDLALLPVWGYGPNLRGDHMTPRDAARALAMLRPRAAVPIHWGTFRPLGKLWSRLSYFSDPPYTFAGYASYLAPETEVHILEPGESLTLQNLRAKDTF